MREPNQELELKAREIKHPNNIFSPIIFLQLPLPSKTLALPQTNHAFYPPNHPFIHRLDVGDRHPR